MPAFLYTRNELIKEAKANEGFQFSARLNRFLMKKNSNFKACLLQFQSQNVFQMKHVYSFLLSILSIGLIAQPVITADWIVTGAVGLSSTVDASTTPDPGPAGANVTWDFSNVEPNDTAIQVYTTFGDPDTTPYADLFPEANLVQITLGVNIYIYLRLTNDEFEAYGLATEGFTLIYNDPVTLVEFPFTYQSSFDDTFEGTSEIQADTIQILTYLSGNSSVTADGWGTIMLPQGNIGNVLRIQTTQANRDSSDFGLGIMSISHTESTTYSWFSPDHNGILANHTTSSGYSVAIFGGLPLDTTEIPETSEFTYDPTAGTSSVKAVQLVDELIIAPNPVSESVNVRITHERNESFHVSIFDLNGKNILEDKVHVSNGTQTYALPAPGQAGNYILTLQNDQGVQAIPFTVN